MQAIDFQISNETTKITQKSHLVGQVELEQQAHLFVIQSFDFQNSKDSMELTQNSNLVAQEE